MRWNLAKPHWNIPLTRHGSNLFSEPTGPYLVVYETASVVNA